MKRAGIKRNGKVSIQGFLDPAAKIGEEAAISLIQPAEIIGLQIDKGKTGGVLVENTLIFIVTPHLGAKDHTPNA